VLNITLEGRVALVVGGSRGIGRGITECLCRAGAATVFTHTGDPAHAAAVASLLKELNRDAERAREAAVDARDGKATTALVDRIVSRHGKLDILVVNAGRNAAGPAEEVSDEAWHASLDTNLTSAFLAVRAALPSMLKAGYGRIILIGSSAVYDGGGGAIDYAAAKAGMSGMVKYLARTYARRGILTNVVHPCVIETDLLRDRYSDPEKRRALVAEVPAGRLGAPGDIAGIVAFLASSWGDFICGQEILVDGGRTAYGK